MSPYIAVPAAPTAKEAIAVQLYRQGRTVAQIQTSTGLEREQVITALDHDASKRHRHPNAVLPPRPRRTAA